MSVLLRQIKETTVELLLVVDSSCEFISNWIRELMVLWCTHVVTLYAYPYPYVRKTQTLQIPPLFPLMPSGSESSAR